MSFNTVFRVVLVPGVIAAVGCSGSGNGSAGSGGMGGSGPTHTTTSSSKSGGGASSQTTSSGGPTSSGASSSSTSSSGASTSSSSSSSSGSGTCGGGAAQASDITINEASLQQRITGFGVSTAWAGSYANASDPEYLWSTTKGAGLTLLRIRYGDGLAPAKAAVGYGVKVWMTVWGTGPGGDQGGPDTTTQYEPNGCHDNSEPNMPVLTNPQHLAATISSWVKDAKTQGVPLFAVSGANEPDSCGINATTSYSPTQLADWITYLGPAMTALGVKNMAPETMNGWGWGGVGGYFTAIQNNTAAWNAVDIFASHEYGLGPPVQPEIAAAGKEYWETEVDVGTADGDPTGDGIASALLMAKAMHDDLTTRNLNAWHLWWLYNGSGNGGCLYDTTTKVWTKRLWVMGNFSRFVRPGYKRVSTSGTVPSGVMISAYIDPTNNALSIVAINPNSSSTKASLYISGKAPCSLTAYETSASQSLGKGTSVTVSQSRVTVTLPAQSVTTFVGMP